MTHPGREPTDPPPRPVPGIPGMKLPHVKPPSASAQWWAHWTPMQITTAAGALLMTVVTLVGGPAAFKEIVSGGEVTRTAIADSEKRILAKIEEQRAIDIKERDALIKRINVINEKADFLAGFASALNKGRPHPSVPTDAFGERTKPAGKDNLPPWVLTDAPYPKFSQN